MKLPFRPRPEGVDYDGYEEYEEYEEYDDGGLDTVGLASGNLNRSILGGSSDHDEYYDDGEEDYLQGPGLIGDRLRRSHTDPDPAATGERPAVSANAFSDSLEHYRSELAGEQRSAWAYLGLLGGMFLVLTLFGWACSDERATEVAISQAGEEGAAGSPVRLVINVQNDTIEMRGAVPDEAAESQLLGVARATYGDENVVDEIEINPGVILEAGTVRFVGTAAFGDERAQQLRDEIVGQFGLEDRGFEVEPIDGGITPVSASVNLAAGQAVVAGAVPDEQSVADLTALVGDTWGPENVDAAGLSVGDTSWTEGRISVTGDITASDPRVVAFAEAVPGRLGALVTVDISTLSAADDPAVITQVQESVSQLVLDDPIQFAPDSAEIETASDDVLTQVAELLGEVPGTSFEVVGHTDSVGDEQDNQVLSEDRAAAVVDRLAELGVAPGRMTSRGEGESSPIADNTTDDGKSANRRIQFILLGVSDGDG